MCVCCNSVCMHTCVLTVCACVRTCLCVRAWCLCACVRVRLSKHSLSTVRTAHLQRYILRRGGNSRRVIASAWFEREAGHVAH